MATINPSNQQISQYSMQTGGPNNLLNNVPPSATSGIPFISQGAAAQPICGTCAIAGGGTNATSMSTSTGIVKYDGTSLVTSSTALIDSSNRYTNTSQPAFLATNTSLRDNITGDGTTYLVPFNTEIYDQNSNYDGAGTFTAPVTGRYMFTASIQFSQLDSTVTDAYAFFVGSNRTLVVCRNNIGVIRQGSSRATYGGCVMLDMDAADTCSFNVSVIEGSGKIVDINSEADKNWFAGNLIC